MFILNHHNYICVDICLVCTYLQRQEWLTACSLVSRKIPLRYDYYFSTDLMETPQAPRFSSALKMGHISLVCWTAQCGLCTEQFLRWFRERENTETFPRFGLAHLGSAWLGGWLGGGEAASEVKPSYKFLRRRGLVWNLDSARQLWNTQTSQTNITYFVFTQSYIIRLMN